MTDREVMMLVNEDTDYESLCTSVEYIPFKEAEEITLD